MVNQKPILNWFPLSKPANILFCINSENDNALKTYFDFGVGLQQRATM